MSQNNAPLLRNSERGSFKKCEFSWDLEFNRRLKPREEAPQLRFGSLVHGALEKFYRPGLKRGTRPATTFQKLYAKELSEGKEKFGMYLDEVWHDAAEFGVTMLENYYDEYGKDDEYEVLVTEQTFKVPVLGRSGRVLFYVVGTMDGVWKKRSNKKILVVDHKTAQSAEQLIKVLPHDDQASTYWTYGVDYLRAENLLPDSVRLNGMLYNILRKGKKDERPKNKKGQYLNQDGSVSKKQPPPLFERHTEWRTEGSRRRTREKTRAEVLVMKMKRSGELPIIKKPSIFTCPSCPYQGPCEIDEVGKDFEPMLKGAYREWDPYDAHEIYEGR